MSPEIVLADEPASSLDSLANDPIEQVIYTSNVTKRSWLKHKAARVSDDPPSCTRVS